MMKEENYVNEDLFRLEALGDIAQVLSELDDFDEAVRLIAQKGAYLLNADTSHVMMLNPQTHKTIKTIIREGDNESSRQDHLIHINVSGWVLKNNMPFYSACMKEDARFRAEIFKNIMYNSGICVPLKLGGVYTGTMLFLRKPDKESFSHGDLQYAEKLAAIVSPFIGDVQKIQEYFACSIPEEELIRKFNRFGLLGRSRKSIELMKSIETAAKCNVRVMIEGESGTGKELVAKAIHKLSVRQNQKFVVLDCSTISANLMESELFGHIKGSFTGAMNDRKGLIEEADKGTLFIDEVSSLPPELQAKFLRFLQEGEVRPLGGNRSRKVDVRVISASNIPLTTLVKKEKFKEDLYFRLNVFPIHVPPLNERKEDIGYLAVNFVRRFAQQQNKSAEMFDEEMMALLNNRHWQGNIRELENFVERMVTITDDSVKIIGTDRMPQEYKKELIKFKTAAQSEVGSKPLNESMDEYEEQLLRSALVRCGWNQSRAALSLKIPEQTLRYKMNKLRITKPVEE